MDEVLDGRGDRWEVEIVSHGRTSGYLNPKVHRPILQFTCLSRPGPRRYVRLPPGREAVGDLSPTDLLNLLERAKPH